MIAVEDTALVLLAAGRSLRFGARDKLEEELLGRPIGLHIVGALEDVPFRARFVVQSGCALDFAAHGYRVIDNDDPAAGMGRSVRLGVAAARAIDASAVLIALADMPRVTATHIHRLFDAADTASAVVASTDGVSPCPPALFGADRFDALMAVAGDAGARDLIRAGRHVIAPATELIDIDTPEDLARLRALVHARGGITRGATRRSD